MTIVSGKFLEKAGAPIATPLERLDTPASHSSETCSFSTSGRTLRSVRLRVNPWKAHTRKIFLACGIVVIPMTAFTVAIIWVVFANLISGTCNISTCALFPLVEGPAGENLYTDGEPEPSALITLIAYSIFVKFFDIGFH